MGKGLNENLGWWLAVWVFNITLIVYLRLRQKNPGCGLVVAYVANLSILHWLGACLYVLPWYTDLLGDEIIVLEGFRLAVYAQIAIGIGSSLLAPLLMRVLGTPKPTNVTLDASQFRLAHLYMGIGLLCYFLLIPLVGSIPTVSAITSAGWKLLVIGVCLALWKAWHEKHRERFLFWFALSFIGLPMLTILTQGFLGYGAAAALAIIVFAGTFVRPRWGVLLAGIAIAYLGISFYVTYMRDRIDIRESVWGGEAVENRVGQMLTTVKSFEWFNPHNDDHLFLVDMRLNQNHLVGASVEYLRSGSKDFARGKTLWQAFLSLIPRILWPEKTVFAGSGQIVSDYTGIQFAEGTSVGVGQVMEFYINFGEIGVLLGFLAMGTVLAFLDTLAGRHLIQGDWKGFAYWYLPGLSLAEVGGSLVEIFSSAAAAVLVVYLVNRYILPRVRRRSTLLAATS